MITCLCHVPFSMIQLVKRKSVFRTILPCLVIWLSVQIAVGVCTEGSGAFIISIPAAYYAVRRLSEVFPTLTWKLTMLAIGTASVLMLPLTRNALATYHLGEAMRATQRGEVVKALRHVGRAQQYAPNHPDVLYARFLWATSQGRDQEAVEFLAGAVEAGASDIDTLYLLARLYAKAGQREKEIPLYLRILECQPTHPEANYCLAMYYDTELHDRARAIQHLVIARDNLPRGNVWRDRCEALLREFGVR